MTDTPNKTGFPGYAIECPENCSTRLRAKALEAELISLRERCDHHKGMRELGWNLKECPACGTEFSGAMSMEGKKAAARLDTVEAELLRLRGMEQALSLGDQLADWINNAAPALQGLLDAYERRIRSLCAPEELEKRPWECAEWISARKALDSKPVAVVDITIDALAATQCART